MQQHEDVKTMFYVSNQQMKKLTPHICTIYDQIEGFMQKQFMGSYKCFGNALG
jgi:hypothetical protein